MAKETYFHRKNPAKQFLSRSFYVPECYCSATYAHIVIKIEGIDYGFMKTGKMFKLCHKGCLLCLQVYSQQDQPGRHGSLHRPP